MKSSSIFTLFLLFPFFVQPLLAHDAAKSYLSIVVVYEKTSQLIYITEGAQELRKIEIYKNPSIEKVRSNEKRGIETISVSKFPKYDNREIFKLFAEYETKGWELHSQNFSTSEARGEVRSFSTQVSYFLFTRD